MQCVRQVPLPQPAPARHGSREGRAVLKKRCHLTSATREQRRRQRICRIQSCYQAQSESLASVDFDLLYTPVHNPVCQDTPAGVKLELGLTVTSLVRCPR